MAVFNVGAGNTLLPVQRIEAGTVLYAPTYITLSEANNYFTGQLRPRAWFRASDDDRTKALRKATEALELLNYAGVRSDPKQVFQLPRSPDTVIPQAAKKACAELAKAFLDGIDPAMEFEKLAITSQAYASVRTTYDRTGLPENVLAGVPSLEAWLLIRPFIRDPQEITFSRV